MRNKQQRSEARGKPRTWQYWHPCWNLWKKLLLEFLFALWCGKYDFSFSNSSRGTRFIVIHEAERSADALLIFKVSNSLQNAHENTPSFCYKNNFTNQLFFSLLLNLVIPCFIFSLPSLFSHSITIFSSPTYCMLPPCFIQPLYFFTLDLFMLTESC